MKNISLLILAISLSISAWTQNSNTGIIRTGESHTNHNPYKEYYLPESAVLKLLDIQTKAEMDSIRVEKYKELAAHCQERIDLADSTNALLRVENQIWYSKLHTNDLLLEDEKKTNIELRDDNQRIRKSRLYYFIAGL